MTSTPKVAIYCRLSQEDRDKENKLEDSNSIQNQKAMLQSYALEKGWELYNIYSDDDYAGSDRSRPKFNELLRDAESKKFDIILCKSQSRFTRELELVEKYINGLFQIWGIRFISLVDNVDTQNDGTKKTSQITGLVNEWFLEDMSKSIKSVFDEKRKNGYHIGSFALYGYKKDPNQKGHLIIDDEAAKIVREVFTLYANGYGRTNIARILNERGIPNPTEYKRLNGIKYKNSNNSNSCLWKYYTISSMITNEMYIGNMVQGKYGSISYKTKKNKPREKEFWYRVENTHEPIIEKDLWNRVQSKIKEKSKPFSTGKIGLFTGKVKCMNCGYALRTSKSRDKYYLKCGTKYVSSNSCKGAFIPMAELKQVVLDEIRKMSKKYLDYAVISNEVIFNKNLENKVNALNENIKSYRSKLDDIQDCLKELYLDKVKKIITVNDYVKFSSDFKNEQKHFENLITETEKEISIINSQLRSLEDKKQLVMKYADIVELDRGIIEELIDYILIGKKDKETKEVPIEIHWNF